MAEVRPAYPDPVLRLRPEPGGSVVVALADGNHWLLADGGLGNVLDGARDRLFAGARLDGQVSMGDVFESAGEMLAANYQLTKAEAADLMMGLALGDEERRKLHDGLVKAVMAAMFGEERDRGYTDWALASLVANGIKPSDAPSTIRNSVLAILVLAKRTVPVDEFVDVIRKSNGFKELLAVAKHVGG